MASYVQLNVEKIIMPQIERNYNAIGMKNMIRKPQFPFLIT